MTIKEAIERTDGQKPNEYTDETKRYWLSQLDGTIKKEIIDTHEGASEAELAPYTDETDGDTQLLVGYPYDDIYIHWLFARIDYANSESDKYENSMIMFNSAYQQFAAYYNRMHKPFCNQFDV